MRLVITAALLLIGFRSVYGQTDSATPKPSLADWRAELTEIVRDIRTLHPDPFARTGSTTFMRRVRAFEEALPSLSNDERVADAMELVSSLEDGHTYLEMAHPRYAKWYPIRMYEYTDGMFVVSAHKSVADLAGAQVLAIAGRPIAEVSANARTMMAAENEFMRLERVYPLHSATVMTGLGYASADGRLPIRFKLADGKTVDRVLTPAQADHPRFKDDASWEWQFRPALFGTPIGSEEDWITAYKGVTAAAFQNSDTTRPVYLTDQKPFSARHLPQGKSFYIRTNYISDTDFLPFIQQSLHSADTLKPERLIIDWRYNFGGDGSQLALVLREFIKRGESAPWKAIYVLTGRKTFSAAVLALGKVIDFMPVSLVGEPSAAALNHYGDPTTRTYAKTGLRLHVSTLRHQLSQSDNFDEFVPVDVPALFSFADFKAGRDPAVDAIARGDEMRSIPVIARVDGGLAARKAYEQRKARFGSYSWWKPPTEFELRQACNALTGQGRHQEAVETCRLNADIHPTTWNVWYNLAVAQRGAGLLKERLGSYRCVLIVAPDNWNVPSIKRLLAQPGNEGNDLAAGCPTG